MKYALISEEQIKQIKDVLKCWCIPLHEESLQDALEILQSLKPSEPVAWIAKGGNGALWWHQSIDEHGNNNPKDVPLFALEQP